MQQDLEESGHFVRVHAQGEEGVIDKGPNKKKAGSNRCMHTGSQTLFSMPFEPEVW